MKTEFEQSLIRLESLITTMLDEVNRLKTYTHLDKQTVVGDVTERGAVIAASKDVRLVWVGKELVVVPIDNEPTIIPYDDGKLTPVNIPSLPR